MKNPKVSNPLYALYEELYVQNKGQTDSSVAGCRYPQMFRRVVEMIFTSIVLVPFKISIIFANSQALHDQCPLECLIKNGKKKEYKL